VLAQQAVDEKSNEITAVPRLLEMLDLKGAVVRSDALNTQKSIAGQIVQGGGDYLLAVKGNHPTLETSLKVNLDEMILEKFKDVEHVYHQSTDGGHGRIDWLRGRDGWSGLRSVAVDESTRRLVGTTKSSTERRYFISSLPCTSGETYRVTDNGQRIMSASLSLRRADVSRLAA
jgi:predicted transposase YbfD/YdcC